MRKLSFTAALVVSVAAITLLNACKSPDGAGTTRAGASVSATPAAPGATPHPTSTPNDGVRRVTVEETQEALKKGQAIVVDVRGKADYDRGHIKGSVSLPRTEMDKRLSELPKDKLVIFYCA